MALVFLSPRGSGQAYFLTAATRPPRFEGPFLGSKTHSRTPHGITRDPADQSLVISARPEGILKRWSTAPGAWLEVLGLSPGSTVCDLEIWDHLALAPCLDGPEGTPGPVYVFDLAARDIRSILQPKADLGFAKAQHTHDAAWYVTGTGPDREVYVLFTSWNPGGLGALKLVRPGGSSPGAGLKNP